MHLALHGRVLFVYLRDHCLPGITGKDHNSEVRARFLLNGVLLLCPCNVEKSLSAASVSRGPAYLTIVAVGVERRGWGRLCRPVRFRPSEGPLPGPHAPPCGRPGFVQPGLRPPVSGASPARNSPGPTPGQVPGKGLVILL